VSCANQLETNTPSPPEQVTLVATGTVTSGNFNASLNDTTLSRYTLLANPYPSQISYTAFYTGNSTNTYNKMWTYSPFGNGNYTTYAGGVIANGATGYDNTSGDRIASGQAFFVQATQSGSAGTVTFQESHKSGGTIPNTLYFGATTNQLIRVGLRATDSTLLDEVVVRFKDNGSNTYNPSIDAQSFSDASQTLAALKGSNKLAIETLPDSLVVDTAFLGVSSSTNGVFQLSFSDCQGIAATQSITLLDNFLGTSQDIRANLVYDFNVTGDSASQGNNRFELVFGNADPLPVTFTGIAATKNEEGTSVKWTIANETNIANYLVERSEDGTTFKGIATTKATGAGAYSIEDANIPTNATVSYYRIKAMGDDGSYKYSNVAKLIIHNPSLITIYPNPVKEMLNISIANGNYTMRILAADGKEMLNKEVTIAGIYSMPVGNLASGVYMIEFKDGTGKVLVGKMVKE
jgi:hypothetical protein